MKKLVYSNLLIVFSLIVSVSALDLERPLPNWLDKNREISDGKGPYLFKTKAALPSDFRIPAEYEPISAVVISWAGYTNMLTRIAEAACNKGKAKVWILSAPSSISSIPSECWQRIPAPVNSVWARDYGPFGLSASQKKAALVDTIYRHYQYRRDDDAAPIAVGKAKNLPVYQAQLILDGGNFMIDSYGNLFTTERTYIWNSNMSREKVDSILRDTFKAKKIYVFEYAGYPGEPEDGTGHIDMFMKLLSDHTVLISTADEEPFKSNGEKAISFFKNRTAPDGLPYKVITVKGWTEKSGWGNSTWYTYTNSLIVNNTVIMPSYAGHEADDAKAEQAYKEGIPGVLVARVNSDDSIVSGGSIHCVTQTIPKYIAETNKISPLINNPDGEAYGLAVKDQSFLENELIKRLTEIKF